MANYKERVSRILVLENSYTEEEANALVKRYPEIIAAGIQDDLHVGTIALALEMAESETTE